MFTRDDFELCTQDWLFDHAPECDDLIIGAPSMQDGKWVADAEDDRCTYELSITDDGNIYINYVGTK